MKGFRVAKKVIVAAVCGGLLLPTSLGQAAGARNANDRSAVKLSDVVLDVQGGLQGVVVDVHGAPQSGAKVVLVRKKQEVGRVQADRHGRFRLSGLRGGVYALQAGGQVRFVRAWTADKAPAKAKPAALIVASGGVVRGQMPLEQFFASDGVIIAGLVAALIAIPIAVSNQGGGGSPASP